MSQITARGATGPLALQAGGSFQSSTDTSLATLVGTRWDLSDGREIILVGTSSTTTTTSGQLYQDAAIQSNYVNIGITSFTAYSANGNVPAQVGVGTNATTIAANLYQGGFLVVNAGTGKGQTLRIASHGAISSTTAGTFTLEDAPNTALATADTKIDLIPPHGANVIQMPTTATGAVVGLCLYPIAVSSYGFLLSKGIGASLSDASVASVGQPITYSVGTAGSTTLAGGTQAVLGYANQTAVSGESRSVFLNV